MSGMDVGVGVRDGVELAVAEGVAVLVEVRVLVRVGVGGASKSRAQIPADVAASSRCG
jgi:hypothetical protein